MRYDKKNKIPQEGLYSGSCGPEEKKKKKRLSSNKLLFGLVRRHVESAPPTANLTRPIFIYM
jgi:hypothetical protein